MKLAHCLLFFVSLLCLQCNSKQPLDPVWNINPYGTRTEILAQLNSAKGVKRFPFSFRKNISWEEAPVPVYINSHLSPPDFEGEQLKLLRYTISADVKESSTEFNQPLYQFLKSKWTSAFGGPVEETDQPLSIILKWNLNGLHLTVTANKPFNSYLVEYQK